jgi:hypothetical protein
MHVRAGRAQYIFTDCWLSHLLKYVPKPRRQHTLAHCCCCALLLCVFSLSLTPSADSERNKSGAVFVSLSLSLSLSPTWMRLAVFPSPKKAKVALHSWASSSKRFQLGRWRARLKPRSLAHSFFTCQMFHCETARGHNTWEQLTFLSWGCVSLEKWT